MPPKRELLRQQIVEELKTSPDLSSTIIAGKVGCGHHWVEKIRRELVAQKKIPNFTQRRGRDGGRVQNLSNRLGVWGDGEKIGPFIESYGEAAIRAALVAHLREHLGHDAVKDEQRCDPGRADVVTPVAVYEVEDCLNRRKWLEAFAQVSIYGQAIDPASSRARVIVCAAFYDRLLTVMEPIGRALGVSVCVWDGQGLIPTDEATERYRRLQSARGTRTPSGAPFRLLEAGAA